MPIQGENIADLFEMARAGKALTPAQEAKLTLYRQRQIKEAAAARPRPSVPRVEPRVPNVRPEAERALAKSFRTGGTFQGLAAPLTEIPVRVRRPALSAEMAAASQLPGPPTPRYQGGLESWARRQGFPPLEYARPPVTAVPQVAQIAAPPGAALRPNLGRSIGGAAGVLPMLAGAAADIAEQRRLQNWMQTPLPTETAPAKMEGVAGQPFTTRIVPGLTPLQALGLET